MEDRSFWDDISDLEDDGGRFKRWYTSDPSTEDSSLIGEKNPHIDAVKHFDFLTPQLRKISSKCGVPTFY